MRYNNCHIRLIEGCSISIDDGFCYFIVLNKKGMFDISISRKIFDHLKNVFSSNSNKKENFNYEIERKFLTFNLHFDLDKYKKVKINQFYLIKNENDSLRVRSFGNNYYLTIKIGKGVSRIEEEFEITREDFLILKEASISNVIEKNRYYIDIGNEKFAELDIFNGKFSGLTLIEVEFKTLDEANDFIPPFWFAHDVTNSKEYSNIEMAFKDV